MTTYQNSPENHSPGTIAFIVICMVLLMAMLLSCKEKVDTQPPKQLAVVTTVNGEDTSVIVHPDTTIIITSAGKDTFVNEPILVVPGPSPMAKKPTYEILDSIYRSQVGVRELTGHNDGPDVLKYQKACGLTSGYSWCACFVKWCFNQAGVPTPITAWSPTCHNKNNIVMMSGSYRKEVQKGDVFTIYFNSLKRIGHTGFVTRKFGVNSVETVEGNTNGGGSRDGDGVYVRIRPKNTLYSITRWL